MLERGNMMDLSRWDLPREVLPGCVMRAQPRAGVCANVTSFDLEMTEDTSVDTERPAPVPSVTVGPRFYGEKM